LASCRGSARVRSLVGCLTHYSTASNAKFDRPRPLGYGRALLTYPVSAPPARAPSPQVRVVQSPATGNSLPCRTALSYSRNGRVRLLVPCSRVRRATAWFSRFCAASSWYSSASSSSRARARGYLHLRQSVKLLGLLAVMNGAVAKYPRHAVTPNRTTPKRKGADLRCLRRQKLTCCG
jgi:hypothetical protein